MFELHDKVALITGAAGGLGDKIARTLHKQGATLALTDMRAEPMEKLKAELGDRVEVFTANLTNPEDVKNLVSQVEEKLGRIDILVNNAGITKDGLIMKMKEEDFDSVLNVNLKGTFNTIRHSARQMLKQRSGKIINISSVSGILGNVGQANYAASKAGVIGLTKTMARELGSRGITVNAIAPGFVDTEMTEVLSEEIRENACKQIILGRFGKPEDIANTAVFLSLIHI